MKKPSSRSLVIAALIATLALVILAPREDESAPVAAVQKRGKAAPSSARARSTAASSSTAPASERLVALQAAPRELAAEVLDLFAAKSWFVPPPPPPAATPRPPPPPSAPPLPFAYVGQYIEGDTRLILLTHGDRLLSVRAGELVDRNYRIGSIKGGQLAITYLPLNIEQSLTTGVSP